MEYMIRSFRHEGLKEFFEAGSKKGIKPEHATKLRKQLTALNSAISADSLIELGLWKCTR